MRNLAYSLESRKEGDNTIPTSRDATFDAKLNNNFAEMIANLKKQREDLKKQREGREFSSSSRPVETTTEANEVNGDKIMQITSVGLDIAIQEKYANNEGDNMMPANRVAIIDSKHHVQTTSGVHEGEDKVDANKSFDHETAIHCALSATSPQKQSIVLSTVLADSKPIAGTPRLAVRQVLNGDQMPTTATKHLVSTAKPTYAPVTKRSATRISSLGPWVCRSCTFHNLRNITKKARCEMCDAIRPIELGCGGSAVEVVNIEC